MSRDPRWRSGGASRTFVPMIEPSPFEETVGLVRATQAGDLAAREELFARYLPRVRQIVALRIGRRVAELQENEDLVQEALMSAVGGLESFEPHSEGSFRLWLAKLVENRICDEVRRSQALKRGDGRVRNFAGCGSSVLSESVFRGTEPSPSQVAGGQELEERLECVMLELAEPHRRVIELRRLCGMRYEEIAEEMELGSAGSARSLFSRAMSQLSAAL